MTTSTLQIPVPLPVETTEARNLDLLFFKEQLRLVVRSNRSRTNTWRKEGNREKEKRNFKNYDNRFKVHKYKWDQGTVLELPTIPEDKIHQSRTGSTQPRMTRSMPPSRQGDKLPRICLTAGGKLETPCITASTDRCSYKTWELGRCEDIQEQGGITRDQYFEPSTAPDMSLSLFKEFVCAYNPAPQSKRKPQQQILLLP